MDIQKTKEQIYWALNGSFVEGEDYVVAGIQIEDMFEDDKDCSQYYKYAYDAKQRLLERLNENEDVDIEIIMSRMEDIGREISMKMFDYGMKIGAMQSGVKE